ncbi:MAG: hypothetical protein QXP52_01800 [Candidatus Aenigmatarchaeota archaeon]
MKKEIKITIYNLYNLDNSSYEIGNIIKEIEAALGKNIKIVDIKNPNELNVIITYIPKENHLQLLIIGLEDSKKLEENLKKKYNIDKIEVIIPFKN